ncbi:hypothetical protein GOP47_0021138 [Adiantum capillus-veneris]|uniref:Pentatricopeptide repeat-containing protein n=1 Tax=Adiantum capillus-veneris TaxID=13818 RepID=A0A9D4UAJ5_ADICA|nr:hypothetical protein GOP47_0021138 [Adiantum capillus-veneris]
MALTLTGCRKMGLAFAASNCKFSKESLLLDGLYTTQYVYPEFTQSESTDPQNGKVFEKNEALSFVASLRACAKSRDLHRGTKIHDDIARNGLLENCSDALVSMYAKCGAFLKAKALLDRYKSKDVFTWNALIVEYVQRNRSREALDFFELMKQEGLSPNAVTFSCILKACGNTGAIRKGEEIHDEIAKRTLLEKNIVIGNALVDMYAKCGALAKAQQVLEELPVRNVISWSALIAGYAQHGKGDQALNCLKMMVREGLSPNTVTFTCVLKACGGIGAVDVGKKVHDAITEQGLLGKNIVLGTALVDMYAKCGALAKARQVLEELPARNVISWSALIAGYVQHGKNEHALLCFDSMQREGLSPDAVTFISILEACGSIGAVDKGDLIYDEIAKQGLLKNSIALGTALVTMYTKCGALPKARQVLEALPARNAITWSALIAGYAEQGDSELALKSLEEMQVEGFSPDVVTFTCLLKACSFAGAIEKGEKIHDEISKHGFLEKDVVLATALVDMYAKCGALAKARGVLKELPIRSVVPWNALISGYVQHDEGEDALKCLEEMRHEGITSDVVTFICILKACGSLGAVEKGEKLHDELVKQGLLGEDIVLGTALLDMYAKCGALTKAWQVLEELPVQDVISWNALITGSVQKGKCDLALNYYEQLQHGGLSPDAATLSCVLTACSRSGLVEAGQNYLWKMSTKYGIKPDLEHYACIVDLFSRAGHLKKAVRVIGKMPSSICGIWYALLSACWKWGDVNIGRWAFEQAVLIDKSSAAPYILMANVYTDAGMQEDASKLKAMRIKY